MAPTSPAKITASLTTAGSTVLPMVLATLVWNTKKATKLKKAAQMTAIRGRQHPGRDHGGDRVGGVVEAVDEVEHQRQQDDGDDAEQRDVRHA